MSGITFDIETTGLLNESSIDYCSSPYKLRDSFKVHCIVVEEHTTGKIIAFYDGPTYVLDGRKYVESDGEYEYVLEDYQPIEYVHKQLDEFPEYIKETKPDKVVAHNGIPYDLFVCKLYFDMDYTVYPDTWCGFPTKIEDTLVTSKTLNPDRFGGHSLENLAQAANRDQKVLFRKSIPENKRFLFFAADMLYYNIFDTKSNTGVYGYLEWEKGDWKWDEPIALEKAVAEIVARQEHRGFKFDKDLAEKNIKELDTFMEERRKKVEPLLPPRPATKAFEKETTPPARQIKKNREPTSYLIKFVEKHGGELIEGEEGIRAKIFGKTYSVPMERNPLISHMAATIDDTTHIKNWLVGLGWEPSEWKDKDITLKSGTKIRRNAEEMQKAINRYAEETLGSNFCKARCDHLKTTPKNLKKVLTEKCERRSLKVITNPSFTRGQEKEICPDLERVAEQFPYAKDIIEYLTYKHRRNSILGGGVEWENEEEAEKGYLANIREDGRIPTPADTCGCPTSRMKHKVVANIPRVTSLYGKSMRGLFGVDNICLQVGYDFDSLEAGMEAHYCWKHDPDKEYCESLVLKKPNDVHTKTAANISKILGKEFKRDPAKNVKYGCTYGAQQDKIAKTIGSDSRTGRIVFDAFWESAKPLGRLKEALSSYWRNVGGKKFILGLDGRKVPTRAEHAILNSLFQSAGVICAKRTMVYHDRLLKEEGFSIDFFRDDWKNNQKYWQQLIAYHDESQGEQPKKAFSFKVFETKESAEEYRKNSDKVWSEPIEGNNEKYVLAYSRACELISKAVDHTSEHYRLNVPLSAGYIVGRNWRDCH